TKIKITIPDMAELSEGLGIRPGEDMTHSHIRKVRKLMRSLIDPFTLPTIQFLKRFRLSKPLVVQLIRDLRPYIKESERRGSLSIETKVFIALHFYATGSYQRVVSDSWIHCVGRSTAGQAIREVTNALNKRAIQRKWIKFPKTKSERKIHIDRNVRRFGIPNVLGFIDGTEITITPPHKNMNPQTYWTRKHHYAINCQVICDSSLYIMDILANYPGSCNDAFIFKASGARKRMQAAFREEPCWLLGLNFLILYILGDSGYPNEPWCIIPLLDQEPGSAEEYFTKRHCRARNSVERCIGVLKSRFRCLLKDRTHHYLPLRAATIIKACTVLHNMCIMAGVPRPPLIEGEEDGVAWVPQEQEHEEVDEIEAEMDERLALDPAGRNFAAAAVRSRPGGWVF
ncbi:Putative nuclease, partial [Frankliniella fusca]